MENKRRARPGEFVGWSSPVPHDRWNALLNRDGSVVRMFPPHVAGTLSGYVAEGQIIVTLAGTPSQEQLQAMRAGARASVDVAGVLSVEMVRVALEQELARIDRETRGQLEHGAPFEGARLSVSASGLAKLHSLSLAPASHFPCRVSAADNLTSVVLADQEAARCAWLAAQTWHLYVLREGDKRKESARSKARGG